MRFVVSVLGIVGTALIAFSINAPWLIVEAEWLGEWSYSLGDLSWGLNDIPDGEAAAYAVALYLIVVGTVISVSTLIGGFITLAGICTFVTGKLMDDHVIYRGGGSAPTDVILSFGIGFYLALVGTALILVSIRYPLDVGSNGGRVPRSKFRTWHLSRNAGAQSKGRWGRSDSIPDPLAGHLIKKD